MDIDRSRDVDTGTAEPTGPVVSWTGSPASRGPADIGSPAGAPPAAAPTAPAAGAGGPGAGGAGRSGEPPAGGWPSPAGAPAGPFGPRRPRLRRAKLAAAFTAVALAAGAVGGVAGGVVGAGHSAGSSVAATSRPIADQVGQLTVEQVAAKVLPSVVRVEVRFAGGADIGSGVILSSTGTILTNAHVVADAANGNGSVQVRFNDGKTAPATIVGMDTGSDLAVIKAQGVSGLHAATLGDSSTVRVGDEVVAIGSPEGLQGTVTSGIVSYLNRPVTVQAPGSGSQGYGGGSGNGFGGGFPFGFGAAPQQAQTVTYHAIQTDASLNPGNSGGPLVDMAGEVIGINSAIYSPTSAAGNAGSVGLGFAIPIDQAKPIITKLEHGGSSAGSSGGSTTAR